MGWGLARGRPERTRRRGTALKKGDLKFTLHGKKIARIRGCSFGRLVLEEAAATWVLNPSIAKVCIRCRLSIRRSQSRTQRAACLRHIAKENGGDGRGEAEREIPLP